MLSISNYKERNAVNIQLLGKLCLKVNIKSKYFIKYCSVYFKCPRNLESQ